MTHTRHEVDAGNDNASKKLTAEIRLVRGIASQLVKSLGWESKMEPVVAIPTGLVEFIPEETLREYAYPKDTPQWSEAALHITARYFYEQRQANKSLSGNPSSSTPIE